LSKVIIDSKEVDLKNYITSKLTKSDSMNFRDVDSAIDYITNLVETIGEIILVLYDKKLIDEKDLEKILKNRF